MFDWNDEELSNIIWDEAAENDDHIVPYPEASGDFCKKKEWSQEAKNNKSNGQKATGNKVDIHGRKLGSSSNFDSSEGASTSGFGIDSWPNLSLSTAAKTDNGSLDTTVSNNLTEITKFDSSGGDIVQLDKESGTFQKDKEQGDFVDYGWANIGSFDDLDRIFSNDDPLFGTGSLGNSDELWSSSKDVTNSPEKSFPIYADSPTLGLGPLKSTSENFEIKTEYAQEDEPFMLDYGKVSGPTSHGAQNACSLDHVEYAGAESKPMMKQQTDLSVIAKDTTVNSQLTAQNVGSSNQLADKVHRQKKPSKGRKKMGEQSELTLYQNTYGDWSSAGNLPSQFKNQFAPSVLRSSAALLDQTRRPLQGPESLQYQQIPNPLLAPSAYGTVPNPYSAMPVLSHIQSGEFKQQPLLAGYEASSANVNPVSKSTVMKRPTMTPQEKIEKLRKRQQMQALLAIQKQQQQLGHQVSCSSDHSMSQKCCQENQFQNVEGSDLEVEDLLSTFPAFDPNSPVEQDDSSTISLAGNDYSAEDTVLYRLQDIISKLDVRIRLCIRDSLFRLSQSATQRHYASDTTSSTNISSMDEQVVAKEEVGGHSRNAKMSEAEMETNPIDRTVAHLLFHRPFELSGKHPDTPDSPASSKLPSDRKAMGLAKPSMGCLPEIGKSKQVYSVQGPKTCPFTDSQTVSCIDNSDTSNNGPANDGLNEIEASQ